MPNGTTCQLVKLPLVIGEQPASVTVDNVTCLDEQAKKVDHIDVVVRDLEADAVFSGPHGTRAVPCPPKATKHFGAPCPTGPATIRSVNVHGTIHKQIYFVNKDDQVRHMGEDVPFTKAVTIEPPIEVMDPGNLEIDFRNVTLDIDFQLPRPTKIQQVATVSFVLKFVEQRQLWVAVCPAVPGATAGIQDESFENWIGNTPALWQSNNVCPNPNGRSGLAAALGCCPTLPAALSQNIADVAAGTTYELTFWTRSIEVPRDPCGFTLQAQIMFSDALGNVIDTRSQAISSQQLSPNNYSQFRISGTAPAGTNSAMVAFSFTPETWNTCAALIDDATFGVAGT
ncbi:hypothetical protein Desca_0050 [Desulfotomaculum nigrificans CO-1-SRB]|uniref:SipL SPOCS domain-containing protein n=1 Tax=Desulfotomaculum nigrificans (strain DSM 14880 / VKM B-2319 / CO-1-SRB) TaxID=868595 RepID=F6B3Z0_DESCC|nr:hypothetical protein [Desulfotomaculum nigrificans]AEF92955.1 hypothetical protein Desca_0050 [Desulfotomaculum nigrificans CO-1-SRB]